MSDQYLGEIRAFGFGFAPRDWAVCNGQLLDINQNAALFSLLGTRFGGNGINDFGLPNLQGRVAAHAGDGPGLIPLVLAQAGGTEGVTLTEAQTPAHNHGLNVDAVSQNESTDPTDRFISSEDSRDKDIYLPARRAEPDPPLMNSQMVASTGGQAHENRQPFLVFNYCIALVGVFPPRS